MAQTTAKKTTAARLLSSGTALKVAMAVSGLMIFGFIIGHMLGNLQAFAGKASLNGYAAGLRKLPLLLWGFRLGLLAAFVVHIASAIKLVQLNNQARPTGYSVVTPKNSTFASRTMVYTGPIVGLYLVYHLAHYTFGVGVDGWRELHPYESVVTGFSNPLISLIYIAANVLLGIHLWHGLWSLFQSLGLASPRFAVLRRNLATALSVIIVAGFISVPLAVMLKIIH